MSRACLAGSTVRVDEIVTKRFGVRLLGVSVALPCAPFACGDRVSELTWVCLSL